MKKFRQYGLIGSIAIIVSIAGFNNKQFLSDINNLIHTNDKNTEVKQKVIHGTVIKVADGDTVTLRDTDGRKHRIRLLGIDAPELQQAHGQAAKKWLTERVLDNQIKVQVVDKDRYKRLIAILQATPENCIKSECDTLIDINLQLVQQGHAWWYKRYQYNQPKQDRPLYEQAHNKAKADKIGLWDRPNPQPPWVWRQERR